ncbi:hypothetical protein BFP97_01415 [Roseivirga sp. 4D4]|uniref:hypothetical protein n=1 Tax=Roseivirga sp. 4D4 TaxID=1889784 RepID=UPI0008531FD6|nr:hypothetical protein [Roseivirga sp. 4D4]OEK00251.1 hypothetical protein BFP97_01415 [Roseivirga sp. 4D4]
MKHFDLDQKRFVTAENKSGLASHETVFEYQQNGETITGSYQGGLIKIGHIVGKQVNADTIALLYHCITNEGALMAGESTGKLSMKGELIQINFDWNWLNGDRSGGKSEYIEVISQA